QMPARRAHQDVDGLRPIRVQRDEAARDVGGRAVADLAEDHQRARLEGLFFEEVGARLGGFGWRGGVFWGFHVRGFHARAPWSARASRDAPTVTANECMACLLPRPWRGTG